MKGHRKDMSYIERSMESRSRLKDTQKYRLCRLAYISFVYAAMKGRSLEQAYVGSRLAHPPHAQRIRGTAPPVVAFPTQPTACTRTR
ncbi:protein of unknown function [Pararobbsia alpina]